MAEYDKIMNPGEEKLMDNLTLDPFDVAEFETWLEDRAKEGWHVRNIGPRLTDFEKGQPKETRYRLTPLGRKEKEPSPEFLDMAAVAGWEYAATVGASFHLWRCEDPNAPEMENDPVAQAEGYRYLAKRMTRDLWIFLVLLGLLAAMYLLPFYNGEFWQAMSRTAPFWMLGCWLYFGAGAAVVIRQWVRLRKLLRLLRAGIPMDRPRPWKRARLLRRVALFVGIPLYFYIMLGDDILKDGFNIQDNADAMAKARYVDVARLNPEVTEDVELWRARTKATEMIPRMYWIEQVGWVPKYDFVEPGTGLQPHYAQVSADTAETDYYRLWTAEMAAAMEEELVADSRYSLERLPSDHLDSFWWCEYDNYGSGGSQYAIARLDDTLLCVEYNGPADLRLETEYLAEVLE